MLAKTTSDPPHVLLAGPPGTGKTSLAKIVAQDLRAKLITTAGPKLRRLADLMLTIFALENEEDRVGVLFIDEIHRLPSIVEKALYEALEVGKITTVIGEGPESKTVILELPPFICVGATTKTGSLSQSLRDRFGFHVMMAPYSVEELSAFVGKEWERAGISYDADSAEFVAERAKSVLSCALHLAHRTSRFAQDDEGILTLEHVTHALEGFKFDEDLTESDWLLLDWSLGAISPRYGNGVLPKTTVIASTGVRWSRNRDARDAFGSLRDSFRTLVMPEVRSTSETMLRWEMERVPLRK